MHRLSLILSCLGAIVALAVPAASASNASLASSGGSPHNRRSLQYVARGSTVDAAASPTVRPSLAVVGCEVGASGSPLAVPAGNWAITSWSTYAGHDGGSMSMMVFRPSAAGSYMIVARSPLEPLGADRLNTFRLDTPIAVEKGDLLGLWAKNDAECVKKTNKPGDTGLFGGCCLGSLPAVGISVTPFAYRGYALNISATVSAARPPTLKDECMNGGWQRFVFASQIDCVRRIAATTRRSA